MPGTSWQGSHHDNGMMTRWDVVCIHTIVGNPPAHAAHFSTRADGYIYQSRDTAYASAANYNGNYRVIAIENDDQGPEFGDWDENDGHDVPAFTAAQIEAIAKICVWAYQTHGIPLVACPDSKSFSRGIAYHRQGIDGNWSGYAYGGRVSGGEVWTKSAGKVCPGDRRIAQVPQIIARARTLAGLDNQEDDVMGEDARQIKAMLWTGEPVAGAVVKDTLIDDVNKIRKMLWEGGDVPGTTDPTSVAGRVAAIEEKINTILDLLQPKQS